MKLIESIPQNVNGNEDEEDDEHDECGNDKLHIWAYFRPFPQWMKKGWMVGWLAGCWPRAMMQSVIKYNLNDVVG